MDIEKLGKSSILSARCRSKIALVDLTGPAAFGLEAERCGPYYHLPTIHKSKTTTTLCDQRCDIYLGQAVKYSIYKLISYSL